MDNVQLDGPNGVYDNVPSIKSESPVKENRIDCSSSSPLRACCGNDVISDSFIGCLLCVVLEDARGIGLFILKSLNEFSDNEAHEQ